MLRACGDAAMRPLRDSYLRYALVVAVIPATINIYAIMRVHRYDARRLTRRWRDLTACERPFAFRRSAGLLPVGTPRLAGARVQPRF